MSTIRYHSYPRTDPPPAWVPQLVSLFRSHEDRISTLALPKGLTSDQVFSTCHNCSKKTKLRKLPLVIHVDPDTLIALNKTCRHCPPCDLLIAHQDEIDGLLAATLEKLDPSIVGNKYLVLGTLERAAWRRGLTEPQPIAELRDFIHDFVAYLEVEIEPGGWFPTKS